MQSNVSQIHKEYVTQEELDLMMMNSYRMDPCTMLSFLFLSFVATPMCAQKGLEGGGSAEYTALMQATLLTPGYL